MRTLLALLTASSLALLAGCGGAAVPSPTPTTAPTASVTTASPGPTQAPSASVAPTASASATPIPLPTSGQVAAAGNGVVWMLVAETRLFRSTDRGETWTERTLPPNAVNLQIAFVDDRIGWAMAAGSPATQCQSQGVVIWRTADGAGTWEKLVDVPSDSAGSVAGIGAAQCKTTLAFVDAQRGYATAEDPNSPPTIYRTSDGGKTWAGARLPDPPGFISGQAGFELRPDPVADFGGVLFVSAFGMTNAAEKRFVFRSTDAGATWTYATTAPAVLEQLVFLTPTRWLQIAPPDRSKETTDAGASWHAFATDYQQAAPITPQIAFGDANTGYATVRGSLQRTIDGGARWTALRTPGT